MQWRRGADALCLSPVVGKGSQNQSALGNREDLPLHKGLAQKVVGEGSGVLCPVNYFTSHFLSRRLASELSCLWDLCSMFYFGG